MKTVSKTPPSWILSVPNNEEGIQFLKQLKKYTSDSAHKWVKRPRNSNRKGLHQARTTRDIRVKDAEYFRMYLREDEKLLIGSQKIRRELTLAKEEATYDILSTLKDVLGKPEEDWDRETVGALVDLYIYNKLTRRK